MTIPAGYGEKYRTEFRSVSVTGDYPRGSRSFRISFYRRGYSGSILVMKPGTSPLKLATASEGLFGVVSMRATFQLVSYNDIPLSEFYADDDMGMLVVITGGIEFAQTVFMGWLTPYKASQPYKGGQYVITLAAQCGLGMLQDIDYDIAPGKNTVHDIVYNCLLKVGYELPLWKASPVYEESHLNGGALPSLNYDAWKNARFNTQAFYKNNERVSCLAVLERFCKPNYVLMQWQGSWRLLYRPMLADYMTGITWIQYDDAADETPAVSILDPRVSVKTNQAAKPVWGATEVIEPAIKQIERTAEYGELENRLPNGYFSSGLSGWTLANGSFVPVPVAVGDGTEDSPFGAEVSGNAYSQNVNKNTFLLTFWALTKTISVTRTIRTVSGVRAGQPGAATNAEKHIIGFSLDFVNTDCAGPLIAIKAVTSQGAYYLTQQGTWSKNVEDCELKADNTWKTQNDVVLSKPTSGEAMTVSATETVPGLGNYTLTVYLYQPVSLPDSEPTAKIVYRNAKLTIEDSGSIIAVREVIRVKTDGVDPLSRKKKAKETLLICDQTSYHQGAGQRENALMRIDNTPTRRWWQNVGGTIRKDKIQNHFALDFIRLQGRFGPGYDGGLIGEPGPLDVLKFIENDNQHDIIRSWSWDALTRQTDVRTVQILSVTAGTGIKALWESSDGAKFTMPDDLASFGSDNTTVTPLPRQNGTPVTGTAGQSPWLAALEQILKRIRDAKGVVIPPGQAAPGGMGIVVSVGDKVINQSEQV